MLLRSELRCAVLLLWRRTVATRMQAMKRSEPGANGGNGTSTLDVAAAVLAENGPRVMLTGFLQLKLQYCMTSAARSLT